MIGFYDYTVLLTYGGMLFGLCAMLQAAQGNTVAALLCIAGSLFCDTADGKVARAKPGRTEQEQQFGIQIDSLCDIVSFGIAPAVFFYMQGMDHTTDILLLGLYCLCCVIRLGYFNVLANDAEPGTKNDYHGLPVVCLAVMMPAVIFAGLWLNDFYTLMLDRAAVSLFGLLYVLDFPVKKPGVRKLLIMCLVFWVPLIALMVL